MSWAVTFNEINEKTRYDTDEVEYMMTQHIMYPADMELALKLAREAGVKSGTLSGCRTPNPSGGPEVVDISIRGLVEPADFNLMIKKILGTGPDAK